MKKFIAAVFVFILFLINWFAEWVNDISSWIIDQTEKLGDSVYMWGKK